MSDHNERACMICGSLLHHEDDCPRRVPTCRICGCTDGEPGLCHAIFVGRKETTYRHCFRLTAADLCSACYGFNQRAGVPEDALRCELRAHWDDNAATRRGSKMPGAYQLRRHAAEMRLKAKQIAHAASEQNVNSVNIQ
jgi:hypothetical protein